MGGQFKEVHHELGAQLSSITNLRSMIESGEFGMGTGAGKPIGRLLADGLYSHHISKLAGYASLAGGGFLADGLYAHHISILADYASLAGGGFLADGLYSHHIS